MPTSGEPRANHSAKLLGEAVVKVVLTIADLKDATDSACGDVFGISRENYNHKKHGTDGRRFNRDEVDKAKGRYPEADWSAVEALLDDLDLPGTDLPEHIGRCFVCGSTINEQNWLLNPNGRFCHKCAPNRKWASIGETLVTMLPDWSNVKLEPNKLPRLDCDPSVDMFARWIGDDKPETTVGQRSGKLANIYASRLLPYQRDTLGDHGFRCGSPLVYRSKSLETLLDLRQEVYVLDLQFYLWSNTLKDPRSWAIANYAIEKKVKSLALWTAGNAGISLAKLSAFVNRFHEAADHLWVYILYTVDDPHANDLLPSLKLWRSEAIPLPVESVYEPQKTREIVELHCQSLGRDLGTYWETTDGWEGLGCLMYRLLMAQVISQLNPESILLPAGTGNFLIGTVLACEDVGERRTIFAAAPENDNIFNRIDAQHGRGARHPMQLRQERGHSMRKLGGAYSPLMPCIDAACNCERVGQKAIVKDVEIGNNTLRSAATSLISAGIRAEPSAVAPFAALLKKDVRSNLQGVQRLLVVNTGCGLLSREEFKFLDESRP